MIFYSDSAEIAMSWSVSSLPDINIIKILILKFNHSLPHWCRIDNRIIKNNFKGLQRRTIVTITQFVIFYNKSVILGIIIFIYSGIINQTKVIPERSKHWRRSVTTGKMIVPKFTIFRNPHYNKTIYANCNLIVVNTIKRKSERQIYLL